MNHPLWFDACRVAPSRYSEVYCPVNQFRSRSISSVPTNSSKKKRPQLAQSRFVKWNHHIYGYFDCTFTPDYHCVGHLGRCSPVWCISLSLVPFFLLSHLGRSFWVIVTNDNMTFSVYIASFLPFDHVSVSASSLATNEITWSWFGLAISTRPLPGTIGLIVICLNGRSASDDQWGSSISPRRNVH